MLCFFHYRVNIEVLFLGVSYKAVFGSAPLCKNWAERCQTPPLPAALPPNCSGSIRVFDLRVWSWKYLLPPDSPSIPSPSNGVTVRSHGCRPHPSPAFRFCGKEAWISQRGGSSPALAPLPCARAASSAARTATCASSGGPSLMSAPPRGAAAAPAPSQRPHCFLATRVAASASPRARLRLAFLVLRLYGLRPVDHQRDLELELTRNLYQTIGSRIDTELEELCGAAWEWHQMGPNSIICPSSPLAH